MKLIDQLLCSHPDDPANARYKVPLPDPKDEETAHCMAEMIFLDPRAGSYEQCLMDSRRMICEPEYLAIFTGE